MQCLTVVGNTVQRSAAYISCLSSIAFQIQHRQGVTTFQCRPFLAYCKHNESSYVPRGVYASHSLHMVSTINPHTYSGESGEVVTCPVDRRAGGAEAAPVWTGAFWLRLGDDLRPAPKPHLRWVFNVLAEISNGIYDIAGAREARALNQTLNLLNINQQAEAWAMAGSLAQVHKTILVSQLEPFPPKPLEFFFSSRWLELSTQSTQEDCICSILFDTKLIANGSDRKHFSRIWCICGRMSWSESSDLLKARVRHCRPPWQQCTLHNTRNAPCQCSNWKETHIMHLETSDWKETPNWLDL